MNLKKIEHIGIAVKDLEQSKKLYKKLLGVQSYKDEKVSSEGVITSFFKIGESKIELLAGINDTSPISKFIEKKGEGFHHIAYEVDDIVLETNRLKKEGFIFIYEQAKEGADNKWVNFIHPKSAGGVLIEICQEKK